MNAHRGVHGGTAAARRGREGRGGFTFAEVLVALLVFVVIIGSVLLSYIGYQRAFLVAASYIGIRDDIRLAMDAMARDIRWTIEPVISHAGHTNSATCLILKVPSIFPRNAPFPTPAGEIINVGTRHDYITYRLNGTNLQRLVDANKSVPTERSDGTTTLARNVTSLNFALKDRNNVTTTTPALAYAAQISLTVGSKVKAITETDSSERLTTTVAFRNSTVRATPTPAP
jgi:type II secretory pathway component PulJ